MAPAPLPVSTEANGCARILRAGRELLAESGPSGMTIRAVCNRAQVKPPAVYYHFGSKDGLIGEVLETVADAWLDELEATQPSSGGLDARIRAAVTGWESMITAPERPLHLLISVQLDGAARSPEIRASLERLYARARAAIARGIRAALGELREADEIADQVLGLVQAAALAFHLGGDREQLRARLLRVGLLIARSARTASPSAGFAGAARHRLAERHA